MAELSVDVGDIVVVVVAVAIGIEEILGLDIGLVVVELTAELFGELFVELFVELLVELSGLYCNSSLTISRCPSLHA